MNAFECRREHDVVAAVRSQRLDPRLVRRRLGESGSLDDVGWDDACDDDLAAHAATCVVCREASTVASLLHEEAISARRDVQVPSAGQVWWRAAIRARVEAAHAAERPMTWLHGLAGACAAGVAVALLGLAWPSVDGLVAWISSRSWSVPPSTIETAELMMSALQRSLTITMLAAVCAILAPLALYLTMSDD